MSPAAPLGRDASTGPGQRAPSGRIGRREFLLATTAATAGVFLPGPFPAEGQETLTVCTYGGLYEKAHRKAYAESFERETGARVRYTLQPATAQIKAQVESGNIEWDLVDVQGRVFYAAQKQNLFEPLDYGVIRKDDIYPHVIHSHGIGSIFYANLLGYNARKWTADRAPRTWTDFYDLRRFPGPRGIYRFAYRCLDAAALAAGADPARLYPIDIDGALARVDSIKDHVVWWTTGGQTAQLMARGEVDLIDITNGNLLFARQQGGVVEASWEQGLLCVDFWAVLRGSPRRALAMRYIAHATAPRAQAEFARAEPYGPVNRAAYQLIEPALARELPSSPEKVRQMVIVDDRWWGEHEATILERWNAMMTRK
jgi:putative spermidine/putrescine transport system substrate-binding protein